MATTTHKSQYLTRVCSVSKGSPPSSLPEVRQAGRRWGSSRQRQTECLKPGHTTHVPHSLTSSSKATPPNPSQAVHCSLETKHGNVGTSGAILIQTDREASALALLWILIEGREEDRPGPGRALPPSVLLQQSGWV